MLLKVLRFEGYARDTVSAVHDFLWLTGADGDADNVTGAPVMEVQELSPGPEDDFRLGIGLDRNSGLAGPYGPYRNRTAGIDAGDGKFNGFCSQKFGRLFTGPVPIFDVFGEPLDGPILKPADVKPEHLAQRGT
ncbi:MAG: hypothetical protein WBX25_29965 [Rhodomicrobium sp.]